MTIGNLKQIGTSAILTTLLIGCATGSKPQAGSKTPEKDVAAILAFSPASVGAALAGGRQVMLAYNGQLKSAQKTRRRINLGVIGTGLYTAIAAGTGAHAHNIVASTAIGSALQLSEPNLQNNGSPESLGSAMVKTNCVIRAGNATQGDTNLLAAATLRQLLVSETDLGVRSEIEASLASYHSLIGTIVNGYMSVYIDQAVSGTPVLADSGQVTAAMQAKTDIENDKSTDVQKAAAKAATSGKKGLQSLSADSFRTLFNAQSVEYKELIATVNQTTVIVKGAVAACLSSG